MQHGLIDDWSGEKRHTVLFSRQSHAVEPLGPPVVKVSLDANLVQGRLVIPRVVFVPFTHSVPRAFPSWRLCMSLCALLSMSPPYEPIWGVVVPKFGD